MATRICKCTLEGDLRHVLPSTLIVLTVMFALAASASAGLIAIAEMAQLSEWPFY